MELYVGLHSFTIIYEIYFYVLSYRQNPKLHNRVGTRKTIGHDSHSLPALTSSPSAVCLSIVVFAAGYTEHAASLPTFPRNDYNSLLSSLS